MAKVQQMTSLQITNDFKNADITGAVALIEMTVAVTPSAPDAQTQMEEAAIAKLAPLKKDAPLADLPRIGATRKAYRSLGKDPARYRPASEALLRRVRQGKGLYTINSLVDCINLISIETGLPVCSVDLDKTAGDFTFRKGATGESYAGIGRGSVNLENLPLFADTEGACASCTSDSERSMITDKTKRAMIMLVALNEPAPIDEEIALACRLLQEKSQATIIDTVSCAL